MFLSFRRYCTPLTTYFFAFVDGAEVEQRRAQAELLVFQTAPQHPTTLCTAATCEIVLILFMFPPATRLETNKSG